MSPLFKSLSRARPRLTQSTLCASVLFAALTFACTLDTGGGIPPEISLLTSSSNAASSNQDSGTATASNVLDRGRIHSGLLIGTRSNANWDVSISLDGGEFVSASVNDLTWSFALPTGANTWKINSSHVIAVRTTNASGAVIGETTMTVYKALNRDVNRDGYPDLGMGAFEYLSNRGRAYLTHGSATGLQNGVASSANAILDGTASGDRFGFDLTLGDINGDGYADFIVGSSTYNGNKGRVSIFYGNDNGLTGALNHHIAGVAGNFGQTVRVGDVNGDGFDDIVAAAPADGAGKVHVFHGSASGISILSSSAANSTVTGETSGDNLGNGLTVGDFNGDGFADIAMGADSCCTSDGRAYIFSGSAIGISSGLANTGTARINGDGGTGGRLGVSLASGDFNGDGISDLALGAFSYNSNAGRTYVFHGGSSGITGILAATTAQSSLDGDTSSKAGRRLAAGDLNGDGFDELVIGGSSANSNEGRVYVYQGSGSGIPSGGTATAQARIAGEAANGFLGHAVGISDLNADGYADLICAAPNLQTNTGRVYLFNGSASNISASSVLSADRLLAGEGTANQFGYSLY